MSLSSFHQLSFTFFLFLLLLLSQRLHVRLYYLFELGVSLLVVEVIGVDIKDEVFAPLDQESLAKHVFLDNVVQNSG